MSSSRSTDSSGSPSAPRKNALGQPIGVALPDWTGATPPVHGVTTGRLCRIEPLRADKHAHALHEAYVENVDGGNWTYLPYGPFESAEAYHGAVGVIEKLPDTMPFAIVDLATGLPQGVAAYLRIDSGSGSIEVGHLSYAPVLQRTPASTEAMYLMMKRVFDDWGYRRYEWKCDSLNAPSIAAARRLGFRFEGIFYNHVVAKGRNRDTTWLSILDSEWPEIRAALEAWLDPANFDETGSQRRSLGSWMPESAGVPRL
jgi:RimJ/RimL family protein N-acetyltransferase